MLPSKSLVSEVFCCIDPETAQSCLKSALDTTSIAKPSGHVEGKKDETNGSSYHSPDPGPSACENSGVSLQLCAQRRWFQGASAVALKVLD